MKDVHPETRALAERLKAAPASLREVSEATGLGWHWLRALCEGRIKSPGFDKVDTLRRYLDDQQKAA